jgi:hypothetical protein
MINELVSKLNLKKIYESFFKAKPPYLYNDKNPGSALAIMKKLKQILRLELFYKFSSLLNGQCSGFFKT